MPDFVDHFEFITLMLALLLGFGNAIFLVMGSIRCKNIFLNYFTITYLATTVMMVTFLLAKFVGAYLHKDFLPYRFLIVICIFCITCYCTLLVIKLLYENTPRWVIGMVYALSGMSLIYIPASLLFPLYVSEAIFFDIFIAFFAALTVDCVIFFIGFKRLDKPFKKFSKYFGIILACSIALFFAEMLLELPFNPLPYFYGLWSVLLIIYIWKYYLASAIDRLAPKNLAERFPVTEREQEIIHLIIQGHTNKTIAEKLYISEKTVKNHIYNIFKKLGITSRFELVGLLNKNDYAH